MTDFLLATVSLVGLLAYSTVAIAIYTRRMQRLGSLWDLTIWRRIGLALAILGVGGGVLVILLMTTHSGKDGVSLASLLWALDGGAVALGGAAVALFEPKVKLIYTFWSALWILTVPFTLLARGVVGAVYLVALVPLRLGRALAGQRSAARTFTSLGLDGRIMDLERELGIGDTP